MPQFDPETWKRDQIRAQGPEGGDDPAGEVARTEAQGFGAATPAEGTAAEPDQGTGDAPDGGEEATGAAEGAEPERRGPGRPRKEKPDGPTVPTKSVRVELELDTYAKVKMTSWLDGRSPGAIIAGLVRMHYSQEDAKGGEGEDAK